MNEARDWIVETLLPGRLSALSSAELYSLGTNLAWWAATRRTSKKLSKVALAFSGSVASSLATIYVAMLTPILYDNSHSPNDANLKYESYQPFFKNHQTLALKY